ncbi:zinc-binding dehydrogenase, partial [Bacillus sp. SIMBA_033]
WEAIEEVDFVFDTIGGETLERSIDITKPGGTIISILALTKEEMMARAEEKNVNLRLWGLQFNGKDLRAFADVLVRGIIKPHIA